MSGRRGERIFRSCLISVGVIAVIGVSVDATETLRGSQTALGQLFSVVTKPTCEEGMVMVERPDRSVFCIDTYEVSAQVDCPHPQPKSPEDTAENLSTTDCRAVSVPHAQPWTHVMRVQADQICARVGKRLPQPEEWYYAARGTPDAAPACALTVSPTTSGEHSQCRSGAGAFDMVGNVWEWVAGEVQDGRFQGATLPQTGYVSDVTGDGLPLATQATASPAFFADFTWSSPTGIRAMMRGGFAGSGSDGGLYTVHADVGPTFSNSVIGFRCVRSLP
jgi:formylglycine-generating enzyme required for sulfatase activity